MFTIKKIEERRRLVFGWASTNPETPDANGNCFDPDELERAAYEFVLKFGETGEMHEGAAVGRLVESLLVTPEKLAAMGLKPGDAPFGWWIGFQVAPATFAKVKAGTFKMFSIQGSYGAAEPA